MSDNSVLSAIDDIDDESSFLSLINAYASGNQESRLKAAEICTELAREGRPAFQLMLAEWYLTGNIVPSDRKKAIDLLEQASKSGNQDASVLLIDELYSSKSQTERARAFDLCKSLEALGNDGIYYRLGMMYIEGKVTKKDISKATMMLRSAVKSGVKEAVAPLANILFQSTDINDRRESFLLCNSSQSSRCIFLLSEFYFDGDVVPRDLYKSYELFEKSMFLGKRIPWQVEYIFRLRKAIKSGASDKKMMLNLYYYVLEKRGSWIGISSKISAIPSFPHGILSIFISDSAVIGKKCTIYQQVTIGSNKTKGHKRYGAPKIGDGVFIGAGAVLVGNIVIGNNCKIAAGATVAKDLSDGTTVVPLNRTIEYKES
ncbi:MAG: SEL1-like repeat protein [Candidatus Methanomethylophilaceae archaeon]|nr:SEL1-like repeat protein [Candidatus Methanomethylophilaceae archaeon]